MPNTGSFKEQVLSWFTLFRLGATARGVLPFILGGVIAWSEGFAINWAVLALSTAGVICVMLMTFLVNEYFDYEADVINQGFHRLSGGSRILPLGLVSRRHSLIAAHLFLFIAVVIGLLLHLVFKTGAWTIPLGAAGILIGYFYTAKPVQLSYRGLGEVAIFFTCGWLANMAGYYLQTAQFSTITTLISFPGAISVFLVILMNEVPDIKSDQQVNKRNLAVRLGKEKTAYLYLALLIICFPLMVALVFFGVPPISAALSVVLMPFMFMNIRMLLRRGLDDIGTLEILSVRTMLIDHLITIIYTVSFLVVGLGSVALTIGQLGLIVLVYLAIFSMEGFSIFSSKVVLSSRMAPSGR